MKKYFPKDIYDTPPDSPRNWWRFLVFNSRWELYLPFIKVILDSRKLAVRGLYDDAAWSEASYRVLKAVERCGGRFHIRGIDYIREYLDEPIVVVINHMSTLETAVLPVLINAIRPVTFVVKDDLVKQRIFGPVMRARDPIVVGRTNPKEDLAKVLTQGQEIIKRGRSVAIFPQSTRYPDFQPEKFNSLGLKLAQRAGVRIMPVAIKTDLWETGKILKDLGPVRRHKPVFITFGPALKIEGNGKGTHRQIVEFIDTEFKKFLEQSPRD